MNIIGYSERGVLNSLLYEIQYGGGDELLNDLFGEAAFPFTKAKPPRGTASVYVEQSLSGFGDPDVVILIESKTERCVIFIEAKVKTCQAKRWSILNEFDSFMSGIVGSGAGGKKVNSSNLFTQIYHKQQFMKHSIDKLSRGVVFPKWSTNQKRKLGTNRIVTRAADKIKTFNEPNSKDTSLFYLMLVPDAGSAVCDFFNNTLSCADWPQSLKFETQNLGFLTWHTVEEFCKKNQSQLGDTCRAFIYNAGQIY